MRLHYHPRSTFSRRVRIALLEKGLEAELVALDIRGGEHKSPAYLAKNPYGRVPTLEDGDLVLYESTAILEYLEALHPTPALVPADARGRALVHMHVKLCDLELGIHTASLIFPTRFVPPAQWDVPAMDKARALLQKHLAIVEDTLGDREWMVADRYTLVEVAYTPLVQFLPLYRVDVGPRVQGWVDRMLARPSAVATKPDR
jgi:glutathione S-transferase